MEEICDIRKLVELFDTKRDEEEADDAETVDHPAIDEGAEKKINPYSKVEPTSKTANEDIDEFGEVVEKKNVDWKRTPKFDIMYKQKVTPEDMYLGVGAKNTSTASCEDMVVSIELPGEQYQNMDLKVFEKNLELISPNFHLNIPLPQPIDPQKGNAQWDKDNEKLTVTLQMDREFDFINF